MSSKKVAIFGCKTTTIFLIENLIKKIQISRVITIDANMALKNDVADYADIRNICSIYGIPIYTVRSYTLKSKEDQIFFENEKFDLSFVIGWQRLIPESVLNTFSIGAFGMHGSSMDLPLGRGRSPMNWAIIEGKGQFYTNLFKYDPGVDSGDVLDTLKFQITPFDNAESMHLKNTLSMIHLLNKNLNILLENNFILKKQNLLTQPTFYPKRNPSDSLIDWRQDILSIERFIRAVAPPFNGAYSFLNNKVKLIIAEAHIFDFSDFDYKDSQVGMIVQVFPNRRLLIKCYGGLLFVKLFLCDIDPVVNDILVSDINLISNFKRNSQGNFDLEV
jgi:methionyl-tRNA formyltransferase